MKFCLLITALFLWTYGFGQLQVCPVNNDFSLGKLTHWSAFVGYIGKDNNAGASIPYDTTTGPSSTNNLVSIPEYNLSVLGIQVMNTAGADHFGGFPVIPKINGYQYNNSVLLGSTQITRNSSTQGGYTRGIKYRLSVPAGSASVPYTMTYAYAMVLENGTHNSNQQPLFSATLTTAAGQVIQCASPKYFLPTSDNADSRGTGATLDTARAKSQGFFLSSYASPNSNPNNNNGSEFLQDVWYKGWTEVTFDLAKYRGQTVTLQFEADNCQPGGHFAYAYVALRNVCDGLLISGPQQACINGIMTYSIPALTAARYTWTVPAGWEIISGRDSSILQVRAQANGGTITVREVNDCADLTASLNVTTIPPTQAGYLLGADEVCSGTNSTTLQLTSNVGGVVSWLASTNNGGSFSTLPVTSTIYNASNLTQTTLYRALVQNGSSCSIDTSAPARVLVDPRTVGGSVSPSAMFFCLNQDKDAQLSITGQVGDVVNWQSSPDGASWADFNPSLPSDAYNVRGITATTQYRTLVKSGVCPSEYSAPAVVSLVGTPFPKATASPEDTSICYGAQATLNAEITIGTSFTWTNASTLQNQGDGNIGALPYTIQATASPLRTTNYVLSIMNAGCPNPLKDTFHVYVYPPIVVNAGNDTSVVINQPLQLYADAEDGLSTGFFYSWRPTTDLNDPEIQNPIAIFGPDIDSIRYVVTASNEAGCTGTANIGVTVYKTQPDIFVPNAFTPGGTSNFVFRPIPVGIKTFQYFRVFNRWGQLMYATTQSGRGWDGRFNGQMQSTGSYVYMVQGISYTGKTIFRKGTMVLIR